METDAATKSRGLTVDDNILAALPPADTTRWVPRRKAEVLSAIANGLLTLDEACARYSLSMDELIGWQRLFRHGGIKGLRATRAQDYRQAMESSTEADGRIHLGRSGTRQQETVSANEQ